MLGSRDKRVMVTLEVNTAGFVFRADSPGYKTPNYSSKLMTLR